MSMLQIEIDYKNKGYLRVSPHDLFANRFKIAKLLVGSENQVELLHRFFSALNRIALNRLALNSRAFWSTALYNGLVFFARKGLWVGNPCYSLKLQENAKKILMHKTRSSQLIWEHLGNMIYI